MQTEQQRLGLEREATHGPEQDRQQKMSTREQELNLKEREQMMNMTPQQRAKLQEKPKKPAPKK